MARQTRFGKWECVYCEKSYDTETAANACFNSHEIILMQITKNDLAALQRFIVTKEEKYLTKSLSETVKKYARKFGK